MRLKHRNSVLFPHPDGPMSETMWFRGICIPTFSIAMADP